jgi:hypothetical protein
MQLPPSIVSVYNDKGEQCHSNGLDDDGAMGATKACCLLLQAETRSGITMANTCLSATASLSTPVRQEYLSTPLNVRLRQQPSRHRPFAFSRRRVEDWIAVAGEGTSSRQERHDMLMEDLSLRNGSW